MHISNILTSLLAVGCATALPTELQSRAGSSCSDLHLVFLVGTFEWGFGIVGTPLKHALASAIPGTTAYAVPYNTSREYEVTIDQAVNLTSSYMASQATACPNQRFILAGYSKGAMIVHRTNLTDELKSKVFAINVFGDPDIKSGQSVVNNWPIKSPSVNNTPRSGTNESQNIASFCNSGDYTCDLNGDDFVPHILYPLDGSIIVAVEFDKVKAGL